MTRTNPSKKTSPPSNRTATNPRSKPVMVTVRKNCAECDEGTNKNLEHQSRQNGEPHLPDANIFNQYRVFRRRVGSDDP